MNEKMLLRISVLFAVIGISALFIISKSIEINNTTIEKIYGEKIGDEVEITGKAIQIIRNEKFTVIKMAQESEIEVIAYDNIAEIREGDALSVKGRIDEYNEKRQIVADKITIIS
ncbi:MAG: hypothetical protein KKF44_10945 [Nanoarchaeota archaeon]|nr:hypothetical protein [Nanoarchaeota archaeon]